jgi:hypothetical protein
MVSGVYFLITYKLIIPHFSLLTDGAYAAWRFPQLGATMQDVITNAIINPGRFLSLAFDTIEKQEKLKYFLYTGGILFFIRPQFALLVVPTFFTTCLSNSWTLWGNLFHYNILFAVLLPFLIVSTTTLFKSTIFKTALIVVAFYFNLHYLNRNCFHDWSNFKRIFTYNYYHQRKNQNEIEEGLNVIPQDAAVSANNYYTSHLAFRDKIYFFPDVKDAEYIVINAADVKNRFYPFELSDKFSEAVKQLRDNTEFEIVYEKNEFLIFKRKNK